MGASSLSSLIETLHARIAHISIGARTHTYTHTHLPLSLCAPQKKGFVSYERKPLPYRPEFERVKDWKEVHALVSDDASSLSRVAWWGRSPPQVKLL